MPEMGARMNGKVCLVTGTTSGIGTVTVREIAASGATTILHCRNQAQGLALKAQIEAANPGADLNVVVGDFASLSSVRAMAAQVLERWDRLDVLVNNAGAVQTKPQVTQDGLEMTFGVNHLAPFLLTTLLLDRLKGASEARIVNVASAAHYRGRLDIEDVARPRSYDGWAAYCTSKLCNVLFTFELARRLAGTRVTANCLHPGVVATGFGRNTPGLLNFLEVIGKPFLWTPEKGARCTLKLALSPEVAGVTSKYFHSNGRERTPSRLSRDTDLAARLWQKSEQLVENV
jgi:NAD(P)-dependent dehydrogenase (short-subunit alcohol dehydrogenase family)